MNYVSPKDYVSESFSTIEVKQFEFEGSHCKFIPISEKVGIKVYPTRDMALQTFLLQEHCYDRNFAPKCWGYDEDVENGNYYYFTEIVLVGNQVTKDSWGRAFDRDLWDYVSDMGLIVADMFEEIMGYRSRDTHSGNWGFKDGNLVMIDFSFDCISSGGKDFFGEQKRY
jgi:hypothetical protein